MIFRKVVTALLLSGSMTLLIACGGSNTASQNPIEEKEEVKEFDPEAYTKEMMEVLTKGETSSFEVLGEDYDALKETHQKIIGAVDQGMLESMEGLDISEDTKDKWKEMIIQMYASVKYEVKDVSETNKGYSVDILINPIEYDHLLESINDELTQDLEESYNSGEVTDDTVYEYSFKKIAELITCKLNEDPIYEEDEIVNINFDKNDKGEYKIVDFNNKMEEIATMMVK